MVTGNSGDASGRKNAHFTNITSCEMEQYCRILLYFFQLLWTGHTKPHQKGCVHYSFQQFLPNLEQTHTCVNNNALVTCVYVNQNAYSFIFTQTYRNLFVLTQCTELFFWWYFYFKKHTVKFYLTSKSKNIKCFFTKTLDLKLASVSMTCAWMCLNVFSQFHMYLSQQHVSFQPCSQRL